VLGMFSENLKTLRKQKGMTQDILAQRLNVVRQTVSKWEKGLSVPDAEMLTKIAELLEVPVSDLLGAKIEDEKKEDEIAVQLAVLNQYLSDRSIRRHKIWRIVLIVVAAIIFFILVSGIILLKI
jgi:transcriptional regulator with XRE-family HTH domain